MDTRVEQLVSENRPWIDEVWEKLIQKMPIAVEKAQKLEGIPYTTKDGEWRPGPGGDICWWTNGFWPASMWQMYLHTGDERYKAEAERAEALLDEALYNIDGLHHDVGFMWHISSGINFKLTGDDTSRKRALLAANVLAGRYNLSGFIRAWNGDRTGWAIVDCMMNLTLLYWASDYTGDPRFKKIALAHADTTMKHFLRPDGSLAHIVIFDPESGEVLDKPGGQGYEPGSSWSRGQAWGLYGFTLAYMHTQRPEYLDAAKRIARYFLENIRGTWIPACDFRAPKTPVIVDDIAGALAACAFIELSKLTQGDEAEDYMSSALSVLKAMEREDADWSLENPSILRRCTAAYHDEPYRHVPMVYGDYFFIEAMGKLRGEKLLFW